METFTQLFGDLLAFVYHCFDRIVIYGYLSGLSRPEQVVHFFRNVDPTTGGLRLEHEKAANSSAASYAIPGFGRQRGWLDRISLRRRVNETENHA